MRIWIALAIVAGACAAALLVEGEIWAALLGLVAGAVALLILAPSLLTPPVLEEARPPEEDRSDQGRVMIDALPEPMMLLHDGRILAANESAKTLLGGWVEGQDVRLALRHPLSLIHIDAADD